MANELQGAFDVTVIEAGSSFHPFEPSFGPLEKAKRAGVFFNERMIQAVFPAMRIGRAGDGMVLVTGAGYGGSTTISAGNAVRMDRDLKAAGIDLDAEFQEIAGEIPVSTRHQAAWHEPTREAFAICRDMGLRPVVTPKMIYADRCTGCGRCVLGCPHGAKWDGRRYLNQARQKGAALISRTRAKRVVIENGRATGVLASRGWSTRFYPADLVVLAAGGLGTPVVLQNSGIRCEDRLFVDPVLCVAARIDNCGQNGEIPMPFIVQKEHYIISPYFDFLSYFFNRRWRYPAGGIYSLMIKLADTSCGGVNGHRVHKRLSDDDNRWLGEGVEVCRQILRGIGARDSEMFKGTLNAGHPGGMLPLTGMESTTLHHSRLPDNVYVSDATLFPRSLGNPPILTIVAMAKRISKRCLAWA